MKEYKQREVSDLQLEDLINLVTSIHCALYPKNCPDAICDGDTLDEIKADMKEFGLAPEPHSIGWHLGAYDKRIRESSKELEELIVWRDKAALDWYGEDLVYHIVHCLKHPVNDIPEIHQKAHFIFNDLSEDFQLRLVTEVLKKIGSY